MKLALKSRSWPLAIVTVAILAGVVVGIRMLIAWTPAQPSSAVVLPEAPEKSASEPTAPSVSPRPLTVPEASVLESASPPPPERIEESSPQGLQAFPPLGTRQLLSGIIVPDGFELPPGYVRHRQTTDSGELLPPILMFHPHEQPLDWRGEPLPVTADRVVPPELAPEGMPIERLEAPRSGPPANNLSRFLERN